MIVLEFLIFVASSGLFCNNRFRHSWTAVLIAGAVATGSSLLFVYDLAERYLAPHPAPQVKLVKQIVRVPVVQKLSQPPALAHEVDCRKEYPFFARLFGDEGTTSLAFIVRSDGTLTDLKVTQSSGSERLDTAALDCVKTWHYRPAIQDGKLADMPWKTTIAWHLDDTDKEEGDKAEGDKAEPDKKDAPGL